MTYDYFTINFASVTGFLFLLIFLFANATLDTRVKHTFYLLIFVEAIEAATYSLELWTTTFETLSPLRLWLSAVGYAVRPVIFYLMLMLAMRNSSTQQISKLFFLPTALNAVAAFSVFFTDIVYAYTPDNQFQRGPLGYITHLTVLLYLVILIVFVLRSHADRPKLEVLILFVIALFLLFGMVVEAAFSIRTINRTSIIMVTIFYYMFFQTQTHHASLTQEQLIRVELENANRLDGSTGLLNKTAFTDAAKNLLFSEHTPPPSHLAFIFLDLDHLKELNDTLGHAIGDIAIADAANAIQSVCRKSDLIGRFGGDEFYVLLPNISKQRLYVYLNEVQAKLQKEYSNDIITVSVSASIGAVYVENLQDLNYEELVRMADDALYEAKASGRNCHIVKEL